MLWQQLHTSLRKVKLTFRVPTVIRSPHDFKDLLSHKPMILLSPSCIQLIHVTLLKSPEFSFECCPTLNLATLIPNSSEPPIHTCKEALEDLMPHFSHISSTPLNNPDFTWYIDGSSPTTSEGKKVAVYAMVSDTEIIESQPLPSGTSSQKADLIALTRAVTLAANKRANIYTDSKYIFHVIHSYAAFGRKEGSYLLKALP